MGSVGNGNGLLGRYYNSTNLDPSTLALTRTDPLLNFNLKRAPAASVASDNFSVQWTGQVQAKTSEKYKFYTNSDDGVRLTVNGKLLINRWNDHSAIEDSAAIDLIADRKYDIKVEYYDRAGDSVSQLSWSSASIAKQLVPQSQLYSEQGLTAQYYSSTDLNPNTLAVTKVDSNINFDWKDGFPVAGVPADRFSVRWTGSITAPTKGNYIFATAADDRIRLWVDGKQLINDWNIHTTQRNQGTIALAAGQHDIKVEFSEETGDAAASLAWSGPNFAEQIISAQAFAGGTVPPSNSTGAAVPLPNSTGAAAPLPNSTGAVVPPSNSTGTVSLPNVTPTSTLDPAFHDSDFGVLNDARPDGVPHQYSWYSSAAQPGWGNNPPTDWHSITGWGQIYAVENWHPEQAPNTRVQIKDIDTFYLSKSKRQWVLLQHAEKVDGGAFASDFGNNAGKGITVKDESSSGGGTSVTAGNGFNYHFWTDRADIDPTDIAGVYTRFKAKLTLDNPVGADDRSSARYIASAGADYWRSKNAPWAADWSNNGGVGGGRFKYITNDWQNFSMETLSADELLKNPPPIR